MACLPLPDVCSHTIRQAAISSDSCRSTPLQPFHCINKLLPKHSGCRFPVKKNATFLVKITSLAAENSPVSGIPDVPWEIKTAIFPALDSSCPVFNSLNNYTPKMWKDVARIWWKLFSCLKLLCFFPTVSSQWLVGTLRHHRVLFYVRRQFARLCHRKGKAWHNAKEHVIVVGARTINITWTRHIDQWSVVKVGWLFACLGISQSDT